MMNSIQRFAIGALTLAMVTLLTGCATTGLSAQRAAEETEQAGVFTKSSLVCVQNSTDADLTVEFTEYDTEDGAGVLAPGARACAEGSVSLSGNDPETGTQVFDGDVIGSFGTGDATMPFVANNPPIGKPYLVFKQAGGPGSSFEEDQSDDFEVDGFGFRATREANTDWVNFLIEVVEAP